MNAKKIVSLKKYFKALQDSICAGLEKEEAVARLHIDDWQSTQGEGSTRIIANGRVFEKGGVNFSHIKGNSLPKAASDRRDNGLETPFEAMGVSVVMHPQNPYVPTVHANLRLICVYDSNKPTWWFGGGYDLTPYYGFKEDCIHWHQTARRACQPFGEAIYPRFKKQCDDYFYLPHRKQARGIGGLFFDDYNDQGFEHSFSLVQSIADHFLMAYLPIVNKRKNTPYSEKEKHFQRLRQGRYVEFNLAFDRGTRFGLQFGGRTESILMSLPAQPCWEYQWQAEPQSQEAALLRDFLQPINWAEQTEPVS